MFYKGYKMIDFKFAWVVFIGSQKMFFPTEEEAKEYIDDI